MSTLIGGLTIFAKALLLSDFFLLLSLKFVIRFAGWAGAGSWAGASPDSFLSSRASPSMSGLAVDVSASRLGRSCCEAVLERRRASPGDLLGDLLGVVGVVG